MYRQILHKPSDCNYLRILWRNDHNQPVLEYKCLTVTYGTACAPFLATQTLCQLAHDEGAQFPLAANAILKDTYVDDVVTGETTSASALELYRELDGLTKCGKFQLKFLCQPELHTWSNEAPANSSELDSEKRRVALAFMKLVRLVQKAIFSEDISTLTRKETLAKKSILKQLDPFLDEDDCLRVGGRLKYASHLPFNCKYPLILPGNHQLTILFVRHLHITHLHAGPQLLLNSLLQNYWVIHARKIINYVIRKCKICAILRVKTAEQIMGNLPKARVTPSHAFSSCGIDYAGPYLLRPIKGRSPKLFKCYIALFICFATRAIHVELVSDLTTDSFLAALRRFISRHLKPQEIFSDCGTNFIGANREMKEFLQLVKSEQHSNAVERYLTNEGIQWRFNPPSAPHMGGLWEAGVEACLNSRPLCPISSNPNDLSVLTPGHFTAGGVLTALPEPDYSHLKINRLSRWQLVQRIARQFWERWSSDYLTRLQTRPKWWAHQPNLQVGDLVLVQDDRLPPQQWHLARILLVHPGEDGKLRIRLVGSLTVKSCYLGSESAYRAPLQIINHLRITD
ncbi:unnamed protein product [Allacma fusca]|uniref:Integrase catalytic domain-containing protein n=1 Tax=Allacma fusca TaxID=39272 RepID=A0A8J2PYD6_9HEXA|nr:unnamed protein product [Allacma fusca]